VNTMKKLAKRMAALVLAGAMMVSAATSAFAAGSPTTGNTTVDPVIVTEADSNGDVKITSATSSQDTLFVAGMQSDKPVRTINSGAIGSKEYSTITLELFQRTKVKKNVINKNAKATKKVIITKHQNAKKLKAKRFNKAAFKNLGKKCTIIVKKSAMTKKEFNKLKKKLKKGGFKGKIKYKK